jgi:hypothetical protein
MFRRYILCLVAMSLLATSNIAQSEAQRSAPKNLIGYLRKEHYTDMYGCTYFIKGQRTLPIFFDESLGRGSFDEHRRRRCEFKVCQDCPPWNGPKEQRATAKQRLQRCRSQSQSQ